MFFPWPRLAGNEASIQFKGSKREREREREREKAPEDIFQPSLAILLT